MKSPIRLLLLAALVLTLQTGCRTASDAAATGVDTGAQAVDKSGRVLAHGARKVENL